MVERQTILNHLAPNLPNSHQTQNPLAMVGKNRTRLGIEED